MGCIQQWSADNQLSPETKLCSDTHSETPYRASVQVCMCAYNTVLTWHGAGPVLETMQPRQALNNTC